MANLKVLDGDAASKYLSADGAGTDEEPHVPHHIIDAVPVVTNATGSGAISTSYEPSAAFWLDAVTLHLSAAPTTSEDFTITLNANDGAAYDTLLYSLDLSLSGDSSWRCTSETDLVYTPNDGPLLCESGDAIDVAFANSDGRTYGLRIVARLA